MPVIIGQDEILNRIQKSTLSNFPRSLILLGERGSGKHSIVQVIAERLNIELQDISESVSQEVIDDIASSPTPRIYLLEAKKLSTKKQNVILKFLEEPHKNSYIIILTESLASLLTTVINRCQVWPLRKYDFTVLSKLCGNNEKMLSIATTPGQLIALKNQDIDSMFNLASTMVDKIGGANYANILTITNKLNIDGTQEDKFDLWFFLSALIITLKDRIQNCTDNNSRYSNYMNAFILTKKLYNDTFIININLQNLFECYLTNLKAALR